MANEIRVRSNNQSGTITNAPLTDVATTITSAEFTDLPTIDTSNHLILILDPLETSGPAEIVKVTAHSASSTSVTVERGHESTTAREHALGTAWFHGAVVSDFEQQAWGVLGRASVTTPQTGVSGATPLTGYSVPAYTTTGRLIKVSANIDCQQLTSGGTIAVEIVEDAVLTGKFIARDTRVTNDRSILSGYGLFTPSEGLHTYTLSGSTSGGTVSFNTSSVVGTLLVEDIGAA